MPKHSGYSAQPGTEPKPRKEVASKAKALSDEQKADLKKHMEKLKEGGMSADDLKSHRMKMMVRMRKGMSVKEAHKDIGGK